MLGAIIEMMCLLGHVGKAALVFAIFSCAATAGAADASVQVELASDPQAPAGVGQQWAKVFADLGVSGVRIRPAKGGVAVEIRNRGTEAAPSYLVVGYLDARGTVRVPGASFSLGQQRRLADWLARLAKDGPDPAAAKPGAFGLLPKQRAAVDEELAKAVGFSTKGLAARDFVDRIGRQLTMTVSIDSSAQAELAAGEKVHDELVGLSIGTALAAGLRPSGLIFRPVVAGGRVELAVRVARGEKELWPIGRRPEQAPGRLVPALAELPIVEIEEAPLSDVLPAVESRLKAPILLDHNALVRHRVDPAKVTVRIPRERMVYATAVRKVLEPDLKYEVRVDEAGKAFLWISTIRP
jgi:hypothetical protein